MAEVVLLAVTKIGTILEDETANAVVGKLSKKVQALKELPRKFDRIRTELTLMSNAIDQVSMVYLTKKPVEVWIGEVRKVAYHVEDMVDKYSYHVLQVQEEWFLKKFFITHTHYVIVFNEIADEIAKIEYDIEGVIQMKEQWLEPFQFVYDQTAIREREMNNYRLEFVKDEDLVGIEENRRLLTRWLYSEELDTSVITVSGMGGLGKSTLVESVYEREKVNFPVHAWIVVSQVFTVEDLLRKTLRKIWNMETPVPTEIDKMDVDDLKEEIKKQVQNSKYLIVLDDVWEQEVYFKIYDAFQNHQASRIFVTTQNRHVGAIASSNHHLELQLLDDPDAFELFCKRAFKNTKDHRCPKEFEEIAKSIVDRCHGLPLAIITIGDLLSQRPQRRIWSQAYNQLRSELLTSDYLKQTLNRSYNDLPPRLKLCLLYLSIFPVDYKVDVDRLMRRWIAEGFIVEASGTNVEETARSYLNELISRNMVQPLHLIHDAAPTKHCKLHPLMYDFIFRKSMEENFVTLVEDQNRVLSSTHSTVYRLSVQNSRQDQDVARNNPMNLSYVRSVTVFAQANTVPRLTDLSVVRVLDLEGCDGPICLDGLNKLLFLRYLSLRGTDVSELPAGIWELRFLETLDVRSTKVKDLPHSIVGLRKSLRTLLYGYEGIMIYSTETATSITEDIQHCSKLENLATIDLREHNARFLKDLGALVNLRMITIIWSFQQCTDESYCEALLSCIEKWRNLRSLTIHCGLSCSMEFLGSHPPPELLEKFIVTSGGFLSVPKWIKNLGFLSFLQIKVCRLATGDLKILRDLPKLQLLILGLDFVPREAIEIETPGFNELLRFSVNCPMPWLIFRTGAMPKLTHLQLEFCSGSANQDSVPYGIGNLQRLTEVALLYNQKWCANSSSVRRTLDAVKRQVAKHRNPINLIINDTKFDVQEEVVEETKSTTRIQSGDVQRDGQGIVMRTRIETWGEIEIESEGDNINGA